MQHPNRVPFEGVSTRLDEASYRAPSGARGHRVVMSARAAKQALPTLIGMAVCFKPGWSGHDPQRRCGVITAAEIVGHELRVRGHLFAYDFPSVAKAVAREELGMSYELAEAHVDDMRAPVWALTRFFFTGAAILDRGQAAYGKTSFRLADVDEAEPLSVAACGVGEMRAVR